MSLADGTSSIEISRQSPNTSAESFLGITETQLIESPNRYGSYSSSMPLGQLFYNDMSNTAPIIDQNGFLDQMVDEMVVDFPEK